MDGARVMAILNNGVRQRAMTVFKANTPRDTGHLAEDAVKLIPVMNYDKFSILVDANIAHYGHILEVAKQIKTYIGPRGSGEREFKYRENRHYGWITQKAIPATLEAIAKAVGGKVKY